MIAGKANSENLESCEAMPGFIFLFVFVVFFLYYIVILWVKVI